MAGRQALNQPRDSLVLLHLCRPCSLSVLWGCEYFFDSSSGQRSWLGTTRLHPASLEQAQAFVPSLAWRQHRQRPWQWQWHRAWPLPLGAPPQRNTESLITGMISCGWSGCVIGSRWGPCLVKSRGLRRKTVWGPLCRAAVACWKCKAPKLFFLSPA